MSKKSNKEFRDSLKGKTDDYLLSLQKQLASEYQRVMEHSRTLTSKLNIIKHELLLIRKTSTAPIVSDHAVLRCLERVYGIDTQSIRTAIAEKIPDRAKRDCLPYVDIEGFCYLLSKDGQCITTIYDPTKMDDNDEKDNN